MVGNQTAAETLAANTNIGENIVMDGTIPTPYDATAIGSRHYELTNHLGNVLATVSDKKLLALPNNGCQPGTYPNILNVYTRGTESEYKARIEINFLPNDFASNNNDNFVAYVDPNLPVCVPLPPAGSYFIAEVITAQDYYPFGMNMPNRKYSVNSSYRYGFNGQENSDEIAAGLTTAMYWEYDSRIARRWNVDPILKFWESSYLCFGGNPIVFSDLHGDDANDNGKKKKKSKSSTSPAKKKMVDLVNSANDGQTADKTISRNNGVSNLFKRVPDDKPKCLGCPIMVNTVVNQNLVGKKSVSETITPNLSMNNLDNSLKETLKLTGVGAMIDQITGVAQESTSQFSTDKKTLIVRTITQTTQLTISGGGKEGFNLSVTQSTAEVTNYYAVNEENRFANQMSFEPGKHFNVKLIGSDREPTATADADFEGTNFGTTSGFDQKVVEVIKHNNTVLSMATKKFTEAQTNALVDKFKSIAEKATKAFKLEPPSNKPDKTIR